MSMAKFLGMIVKHVGIFARARRRITGNLGRTPEILLLIAVACGSTRAQYLGFAANSADNTASVFAVVTSGPTFGNETSPGNQDHLIATVPVGKNPFRIAVTPSPNLNRAYITNPGDNSLWVIDVTNIANGRISATNVNDTNNKLQLSSPHGIAIASVSQGTNKGKVLAFVTNISNLVSVIDTSNDTLFGTVSRGSGSSAPLQKVEVAATPDGTQVFMEDYSFNNCSGPSSTPCPGVWMIDATTVKNGTAATSIPVSGLVSGVPVNLVQPSAIATAQYSDSQSRQHTLVVVADFGAHADGNGYVFVLDRLGGSTISTTPVVIPNTPTTPSTPTAVSTFSLGGTINAEVVDSTGNALWAISNITSPAPAVHQTLFSGSSPEGFAVTPDGKFAYVATIAGINAPTTELVENVVDVQIFPCLRCGNNTSVKFGSDPIGLAFSNLDPASLAVVWFIPHVSGGFDPPSGPLALGPNGAHLAVSGESMVGVASQPIQTTLSFGSGNSCAIFDTSKGSSGTPAHPDTCTANPTNGGNGIGGTGTFPASGVFPISLGTIGGSGAGGSAFVVHVGATCVLTAANVNPTNNVEVLQLVTVNLSCTAPKGDTISSFIAWGDGVTSSNTNAPVMGNDAEPVTLTFSHVYSVTGSFSVQVASVSDVPIGSSGFSGSFTGGPVTVTVVPISVQINGSNPISVQASRTQPITATVNFDISNRGVNWTLSGAGCAGAACGTLSNSTSTTVPYSVTYTAPSVVPSPSTVTLKAASIADPTRSSSVAINVTAIAPPTCTLMAPTLAQVGASVTATLSSCTAPAGYPIPATIYGGEKTTPTATTATASGNGSVTFSPSSFNHTYTTAGAFSTSAKFQDNAVTGLVGSTTPTSGATNVIAIQPPSSGGTSITVGQGQSGTFKMNLTGGPAGLKFTLITCSVSPTGPTCTVSPTTLTLDASGNGSVQVTVNTKGPGSSLSIPQGGNRQTPLFAFLLALSCLGFVFLGVGFSKSKARNRAPWGLLLLLLIVALLLSTGACTSVQRSNITCASCTTPQAYTVTVIATSTSPAFQASGIFTVNVAQ